jgi:hypothetical protein
VIFEVDVGGKMASFGKFASAGMLAVLAEGTKEYFAPSWPRGAK